MAKKKIRYTVTEARAQFAQVLETAQKEVVTVTFHGEPVAEIKGVKEK